MAKELHTNLKELGKSADTDYQHKGPDKQLLECFPSPHAQADRNPAKASLELNIVCPEFTSLCPKTGQPDFATIVVNYKPDQSCVESKSLKLYLGSFRNFGEFHESCVVRILNDLVDLIDPLWMEVEGQFTPRGGIPFWPTASYVKPSK